MASTINANNNRTIRNMPKDKGTQAWVAFSTTAGLVIDATRRALVADVIARLWDAHLASSLTASAAAVSHGVRAVTDSVTGQGAPFFVEARGAGVGEVYLFDGAAKLEALRAFMPEGHIASTRTEAKGGAFVTLAKEADADLFYRFCALHASVRGPVGYSSMGGTTPVMLEAPQSEAAPDATVEAAPVSKRQAKRAAKAASAS